MHRFLCVTNFFFIWHIKFVNKNGIGTPSNIISLVSDTYKIIYIHMSIYKIEYLYVSSFSIDMVYKILMSVNLF